MCVKIILYTLAALPACSSLKISTKVERNEWDPVASDVTLSTLNCSNGWNFKCWKKGGHSVKKSKESGCSFHSKDEVIEHLTTLGYCTEWMFIVGLYEKGGCTEETTADSYLMYFPDPPFECMAKDPKNDLKKEVSEDPKISDLSLKQKERTFMSGFSSGMIYKSVYVGMWSDSCLDITFERGMINCFDGFLENRYMQAEGPVGEEWEYKEWYNMDSDFTIPGFPGLSECALGAAQTKILDDSLESAPMEEMVSLKLKETKRKERGGFESVTFMTSTQKLFVDLPESCGQDLSQELTGGVPLTAAK